MKSKDNILKIAKDSFTNQGNAILNLHKFLTPDFENAIKTFSKKNGASGAGYSLKIAKISASSAPKNQSIRLTTRNSSAELGGTSGGRSGSILALTCTLSDSPFAS